MNYVIGLDPGRNSGGIAILGYGVPMTPQVWKMESLTDAEIVEILAEHDSGVAWLEDPRNAGLPGNRNHKAIAMPAESFGFLRGVLSALQITTHIVRPQVWQKPFRLPTVKQCNGNSTLKKRGHREAAQRLYPGAKVTNWSADSILISEYGRRQLTGE